MSRKIRVGMIRADKRALWFGAIFDDIDPVVYAELDPLGYHHLTYYSHVALTHKRAEGFQLCRVYDPNSEKAEQLSMAFRGRPVVCNSLEEVLNGVDLVFIANEATDGSEHLALATPGLQAGIPTFIDRPLAGCVAEARGLLRLARRKQTPLLSCSHLRLLPHVQRFRMRYAELEPIERGSVHGHGPNLPDIADGVELALALIGDQMVPSTVEVYSSGEWVAETLLMTLNNETSKRKLQMLIVNGRTGGERHAFHASVASNMRQIFLDDLDLFVQAEGALGVMNALREMVHRGRCPLSSEEMLRPIAALEVARHVHNTGKAGRLPW